MIDTATNTTDDSRDALSGDSSRIRRMLEKQKGEMEAVLASIADPLLVFDEQMAVTGYNPSAQNNLLADFPFFQMDQLQMKLRIHPENEGGLSFGQAVRETLSGQIVRNSIYAFCKAPEAGLRYAQVSMAPIEIEGSIRGGVMTWHEITHRMLSEQSLKQSEQRYSLAQKAARIGSWDWNIRTNEIVWSEMVPRLFHLNHQMNVSSYRDFIRLIFPEDRRGVISALNACIEAGGSYDVNHRIQTPKGEIRWLREIGNVVRDQSGLALHMLGIVQDITTEKEAEGTRRLLAEIAASSEDAIIVQDLKGKVTSWNLGAEATYKYSSEEMLGKSIGCLVEDALESEFEKIRNRVLNGERIHRFTTRRVRKDGKIIHVSISQSPLKDHSGRIYGVSSIERDITKMMEDRRALEEAKQMLEARVAERTRELEEKNKTLRKEIGERKKYQEKLHKLSLRLADIEEIERRRIASGLHDGVVQYLALAKIKCGLLRNSLRDSPHFRTVQEVHEIIDRCIHDTRTLTFELSPPILYEIGLEAALEWLVQHFGKLHGFNICFSDDGRQKPLADSVRNLLFHAVRELLINVAKHARAQHVELRTSLQFNAIRIDVLDDGIGFAQSDIEEKDRDLSGFGIFNIRERLQLIQGVMELMPIDRGAHVRIEAPLRQPTSTENP